ncbi:MAG: hypothetical protein Q9O74_08410 [Planctomycetota bacterium]|nr:hypothetical protein [Planctomycetota bacterium]
MKTGTAAAPAPTAPAQEQTKQPLPQSAEALWARALDASAKSVRTQSMLSAATPITWEGNELTVEIGGPMRAVLDHRREEIEKLLRSIASKKVTLTIRVPEGIQEQPADLPPDPQTIAEEHPLVREAMELFDGRVERAAFRKKKT